MAIQRSTNNPSFLSDDGRIAVVSTLAGSGEEGFADGKGSAAQFDEPNGIAVDAAGNLYVADMSNQRIRKVTPEGEVSTLAGGKRGFADGQGSAVQFAGPGDIAIDTAGNLYVTDIGNSRIRKITPQGEVSTFAGSGPTGYDSGGYADGQRNVAHFKNPVGITMDAAGNLYVTDTHNHRIRKVTPQGAVSTLAGDVKGFADGKGNAARFNQPDGIAVDAAGNLYVADRENHRIRKVTPKGEVSTLAGGGEEAEDDDDDDDYGEPNSARFADGQGSAARFNQPSGIAIDAAGNLYVADTNNHRIRKVTKEGEVSTLAGSDETDFVDGEGSAAQFFFPSGITIDAAGNLYVVDYGNASIRKIEFRRP